MSLAAFLRVSSKKLLWGCCLSAAHLAVSASAHAATPSVEQALALKPVQKDVEFDIPTAAEVAKCSIQVEKVGVASGWLVKDPEGRTLRRFIDTNGDNTVDQWSYFADGLEVYRDVDSNSNGKADQFRWLNTGGSRWALDTNEDGKIDSWKAISAEEVSAEAVQALSTKDSARFQRLLLTSDELKTLGIGEKFSTLIGDKLATAPQRFTGLMGDAKIANVSTGSTRWLNFSGTRPGIVPAGTDGTTKDVLVYENVAAMMEVGDKTSQVQIGTMIRVNDVWRLVDVPAVAGEGDQLAAGAVFFNASAPMHAGMGANGMGSAEGKEIFDDLQAIEDQLAKATSNADIAVLKKKRADLIEKALPALKEQADRALWTRQLIDTLSEGVQTNTNPEFLARLKDTAKKLADGDQKDMVSYARFSSMTSEYILSQSNPKADFVQVQAKWLEDLRAFVKEFPAASESAEALLHLAIDSEFAGKEDDAKKLYSLIAAQFPQSGAAKKAAGAARRLDSIGKVLPLTGTTVDGKQFDLKMLSGKPVVLYYWASNGATTAGDVAMVKQVQAKFARDIAVVGISLDIDRSELESYLQQNRLPWINLFDKGGMDNAYANQLGILTIPTILLVDGTGKVVNRGVHISELDREISTLLRR